MVGNCKTRVVTLVLEVPAVAALFGFTPVSWPEYGIALALAFCVIPIVELVKLIQRSSSMKLSRSSAGRY